MLDDFKTERYTIMFSEYVKMRAPPMAIAAADSTSQTMGSGFTFGQNNN